MSRASFLGLGGAAAAASGGRARLRLADDADCGCLLLVPALPAARDGASAAAAWAATFCSSLRASMVFGTADHQLPTDI